MTLMCGTPTIRYIHDTAPRGWAVVVVVTVDNEDVVGGDGGGEDDDVDYLE